MLVKVVIFYFRKAEINALKRFQYLEGTQVSKSNHFVMEYVDAVEYVDTFEYVDTCAFTVSDVELRSVPGRRWIICNICPH